MSYNCHAEYLGDGRLRIKQKDFDRLYRAFVLARDGGRCRYCDSGSDLSLDHLRPPRMGGGHGPENLVTACRSCNSRKGSRTPEQAGMALVAA